MKKLDYVDTMRGIAILLVILVHTAQSVTGLSNLASYLTQYGQMGVQLFFVASAYTLCLTFVRRQGEPQPVVSFFIRRFFRIAPLYYVAIFLYFAVHLSTLLWSSSDLTVAPYTITNIFSNLLFIHGFVPSANNNIVPGGWSIGTEMAFYVCFPLLFALFTKLQAIRPSLLWVATISCLVLNIVFQLMVAFFSEQFIYNNNFLYFNLINQLPVFLLGMTAFFLHHSDSRSPFMVSIPLHAAGFVLCTACAAALWKLGFGYSLAFAFLPTISGLSFFFLLNLLRSIENQSAALRAIGKASYSMYVFHFIFAYYLFPAVLRKFHPLFLPEAILFTCFVLVTGLTFVMAVVSERVIEARGISVGNAVIAWVHNRSTLPRSAARVPS